MGCRGWKSLARVGFQACDHHPEHRVIREEAGGIEGTTNHDVTGRFSEVHQLRGRVAQLQAQVDSPRTVPSAVVKVRIPSAHVAGMSSFLIPTKEGSPGGHSGRGTPRNGEDLPTLARRPPRERRKNEISGGREKKKREISGPPPFGPPFGPPPLLTSPGRTPPGPHPFEPPKPPHITSHSTPTTNTSPPPPPTKKKKNWPNAVWPNSVKQNWPNSAK